MRKFTKTDAAKKLGVTRRTVYNLIKRGTLVPDENGLITLDVDSIPELRENTRTNSQSVKSVLESSERLKDKYIASLEARIKQLNEVEEAWREDAYKYRDEVNVLELQLGAAKLLLGLCFEQLTSSEIAKIKDKFHPEDPIDQIAEQLLHEVEHKEELKEAEDFILSTGRKNLRKSILNH